MAVGPNHLGVLDASDSGAAPLLCLLHAAEICPISGNQRAASVGEDENQMQSSFTMRVDKDCQRLPFEWMVLPSDYDVLGKVVEVGSLSCLPCSLEHRYLMAQGDVFSLQRSLTTNAGEQGTERY